MNRFQFIFLVTVCFNLCLLLHNLPPNTPTYLITETLVKFYTPEEFYTPEDGFLFSNDYKLND